MVTGKDLDPRGVSGVGQIPAWVLSCLCPSNWSHCDSPSLSFPFCEMGRVCLL